MQDIVLKYLNGSTEEDHRYDSWTLCYQAFNSQKNERELALHLGFYLASWGMYRGSSGLLQKSYLVHLPAVNIIRNNFNLRCFPGHDIDQLDIQLLIDLIKNLKEYYGELTFLDKFGEQRNITATDTLISKIMLGTLGCLPAFDRFFIDGVKIEGEGFVSLKLKNLKRLFEFVKEKNHELEMLNEATHNFPKMKLIDMYFWQLGYDEFLLDIQTKQKVKV